MDQNTSVTGRMVAALASLRLTVAGLFLLLILTVWGTLYQVDYGLYGAQARFYQTWFFMVAGFIPFPGAQSVMLLLFVNLVAAMGRLMVAHKAKWGLVVTHSGLLLMLAAGGITFYFGEESHLALSEGEASNVSSSDREWELALWRETDDGIRDVSAHSIEGLKAGDTLSAPAGNMLIEVDTYMPNCRPSDTGLAAGPAATDPSDNFPGLLLNVGIGGRKAIPVTLWGGTDMPAALESDDGTYSLALRRRRFPLPATIQLVDFQRVMHPGSGIARSFSSQVIVDPNEESERRVLISMNKPLRISGFTFYQSSYMEGSGREISVFAVVKNYGRLVPYIATGVTVAGMFLHFIGIMVTRMQRVRAREAAAP